MGIDKLKSKSFIRLPKQPGAHWRGPFFRFLHIEAAAGAALLLSTITALVLSNSPLAGSFFRIWEIHVGVQLGELNVFRSLKEWINDGLMTLFFFLVALELKRQIVLGELKNPRIAALSIAAAAGGMLIPAALYFALQWDQSGAAGWGVVMATDTAFVVGCLALLGTGIPKSLRVFMLSLAIFDDIGAILVVALGYSSKIVWFALGLAALGIVSIRIAGLLGVRGFPVYFLIGSLIWIALDISGIHATLAGVILGLMTPARRWVSDDRLYAILDQVIAHPTKEESSCITRDRETLQVAEIAARESLSPIERLEFALHPWVGFVIMPLFALANAGIEFSFSQLDEAVTTAVFLGFIVGKPAGILLFSWLAIRLGVAVLPTDLKWRSVVGGSLLAGIGFTMAIFIADLALADDLLNSAKVGIFAASLFSALIGFSFLRWIAK